LEDYFKLLKQNKFDENTSIDMLEQMIKYFEVFGPLLFKINLKTLEDFFCQSKHRTI